MTLNLMLISTGRTPVYICAQSEHLSAVEAIELLHRLGADINLPRDNGETPAFAAASGGHGEVLKLLANLGADVNRPDNGGKYDEMSGRMHKARCILHKLYILHANMSLNGVIQNTRQACFQPLWRRRIVTRTQWTFCTQHNTLGVSAYGIGPFTDHPQPE